MIWAGPDKGGTPLDPGSRTAEVRPEAHRILEDHGGVRRESEIDFVTRLHDLTNSLRLLEIPREGGSGQQRLDHHKPQKGQGIYQKVGFYTNGHRSGN
jgi:hypothetical protein